MMSMRFPYGNTSTEGQQFYEAAARPNFELNYNQYFASFYAQGNGLLPTPLMPQNRSLNHRECQPLMSNGLLGNPFPPARYNERSDVNRNQFVTFIKQKSKPLSELNPFANEFSLANHQSISMNNEKNSSYRLIFDDLIEHSLQSIEAIKKASKSASVSDVSIQCDPFIDQINRSTQTNEENDEYNLLEECSSRAMKLTEILTNFFLLSSSKTCHDQLHSIRDICDELRYLILVTNQLITTSKKSSINRDNLFSNRIKDLSIRSSPIRCEFDERTCRVIPSSISAFASRQIDSITTKRSKLCLLCRRPMEDIDDEMHELCRLLSNPPVMNT